MYHLKSVIISILLLIPFNLFAGKEYTFSYEFGQKGEGDGQFSKKLFTAFDKDGEIYITDTENYKILKYSATGRFLSEIKGTDSSDFRFINPTSITIGTDKSIYVMDWTLIHILGTKDPKIFNYGPCIHKFDQNGFYVKSILLMELNKRLDTLEAATPGLDDEGKYALIIPNGDTKRDFLLTIDSKENLYVYDDGFIYKLDSEGIRIKKFTISQPGVGQVIKPSDITVDKSENLYIVDEIGNRVIKFDSSGKFLWSIGSYGDESGQFIKPFKITSLKDGSLLIADKAKYLKDFLSTLPKRLHDPTPQYEGFSKTFRFRIRRIQRINENGEFTQQLLIPFQRETEDEVGLILKGIDSDGSLYYLNTEKLHFRKYTPKSPLFSSMFQTELKLRYTRDIHDVEIDNQDDLDADLYTKSDFDELIIQDAADAHLTFSYDFNEDLRVGISNQLTLLRMTDTSYYRARDFEDFRGTFNQDDKSTELSLDNRIQFDLVWVRDHSIYRYREARLYGYFSTIRLDFINDALDRTNYRYFDFFANLSDWGGGIKYDINRSFKLNFEITHFFGKNNYTYLDETNELYATGMQQADTIRAFLYLFGFF
ncbi:NHL repeat-containing protein [Candidatus Poribacteria bacterium]|nr:NHL repeat-containing protein [Candidatus Poribacteria bacterium]